MCDSPGKLLIALFLQVFHVTLNRDATLVERGVVCLINSTRFVAQQFSRFKKLNEVLFQAGCVFRFDFFLLLDNDTASFQS
ncbi:hypothetical protein PF005_g28959 [Phytophthora fragariae]|uniref:Secreted protein n=1 Tax=Phytophthora fragariae TaxID=53985 RepID=A0A6A3VJU0_9STRA|nr:hypothetical protein PF003_g27987 [Phytophthora fragariae]KAE8923250.1 hypothetical protein PF009_g26498 [Phytophthora fragariae]KAE8972404.1 hypothetical protein PF011_g25648 [Phytophthora fragariae]KAE9075821.1 hypothetical protein PF007_g24857 [Phytophthora fragariae]KAE9085931.1 hypothetical protein PF006_g26132 [Phytophthora fragariae]